MACGILVSQPGTEPAPPELEAQSLNHWTTTEFPEDYIWTQFIWWDELSEETTESSHFILTRLNTAHLMQYL